MGTRNPVQRYDVFDHYRRRWRNKTLAEAAQIMQLDEWEISSFVEEGGRCDTVVDGRYLVAVETGDRPGNHPVP